MPLQSMPDIMRGSHCTAKVFQAHPGHNELIAQDIMINTANIVWMRQISTGVFRVEMTNGLILEIQPLYVDI